MLGGHVDVVTREGVSGWAADPGAPEQAVEVVISADGVECGRVVANTLRSDLRLAGRFGSGEHGFTFRFTKPLSTVEHRVEIRFAADRRLLGNGAVTLPAVIPHPSAGGRPRYVLHVGPHKTGTKYLQGSLHHLRDALATHGILYPAVWTAPPQTGHYALVQRLARCDPSLADEFRAINGSGNAVVVISSEAFADLAREPIGYLRELLDDAPIEIVFYCRRWSELMHSGWQEMVKHGSQLTLIEYLARHMINPYGSNVLNIDLKLRSYAEAFGVDRLRLVSYTNVLTAGIDLFSHFAGAFLDWPDAPLVPQVVNASLSLPEAELIRALNVLEHLRGVAPGGELYQRWLENREKLDAAALMGAIERDVHEIPVREDLPGLITLHQQLAEQFGTRMVPPLSNGRLFPPADRQIAFAGQNYLLESENVTELRRIHAALTDPR